MRINHNHVITVFEQQKDDRNEINLILLEYTLNNIIALMQSLTANDRNNYLTDYFMNIRDNEVQTLKNAYDGVLFEHTRKMILAGLNSYLKTGSEGIDFKLN